MIPAPNLSKIYRQARLSGQISLAARDLKTFPVEVCTLLDRLEPVGKVSAGSAQYGPNE